MFWYCFVFYWNHNFLTMIGKGNKTDNELDMGAIMLLGYLANLSVLLVLALKE